MASADKLLSGVKTRVTIPNNQALLQDPDILTFADDAIASKIVPEIMSLRQNYFVVKDLVPSVTGQANYDIPNRALGRSLRDIKYKSGTLIRDLFLIDLEDEHLFQINQTNPQGFYFFGDGVVIVPAPGVATDFIEMWYERPPSSLVLLSSAARVTSSTATTVTVDAVPTGFTAMALVDFIKGRPGYVTYGIDYEITNVTGPTITFASVPATIQVGDYLSLAGTSPFTGLPDECDPYLETLTSRSVLQAIGDYEGMKALEGDEKDELSAMQRMLAPRIRGESTKIINRNGLLRGNRTRFRRNSVL